ncbi:MAG: nucleotidyltransferase family protein [Betaproteobacteria bacterium]|nr:nucleotidyltransferase family protein [Betaproteobacteria bacterium]
MKPSEALATHREKLLAIAAGHGASNLRVFGSVAKGIDREGSDIDLLVDIRQGTSLFDLVGMQQDFEDVLGMKVDLLTEPELHPELKERVLSEARTL